MTLKPLSRELEERINSYIDSFVREYADGYQMFNEQNAKGLGTVEDLSVLEWMYYEGIYSTEEELIEATAYLVGKALVRYAGFEWGEIDIHGETRLVLVRKEYDYSFTPLEYVLIKHQLLFGENYSIEDLFFDAIFLSDYRVRNDEVHPLFALNYTEEYQSELGFSLPIEIKTILKKFWEQDYELLIRELGIEFYEQYYEEDWKTIETKLKDIDFVFSEKYYKNKVWVPLYESTVEMLKIIDMEE